MPCRICKADAKLDRHHIISQGHARKTNQLDLLTNQGNIVFLCRKCHNQTTASKAWKRLNFYESEESKLLKRVQLLQDENVRLREELDKPAPAPPKSEPSIEQQLVSFMKNLKKDLKKLF